MNEPTVDTPLAIDGTPLCVLTVHAHPDDEASKGAPTLAKYSREGVRTVLVCCTGGEEGDLQNPALREPGQLFHGLTPDEEKQVMADLRPVELAESAAIIGFSAVHMLGFRDSGMAGSPANLHPDCFHMADVDAATERLVRVIRAERPQVIITYNDDQAGYPHPDHLRVHDISVLAFERSGDPEWYPAAGSPWQPSKMYYTLWSRQRLLAAHEAIMAKHGSSPYDEAMFSRPSQDHRITTRIDVGDYFWARSGALRAHATQVDPTALWWFGLDDDELARVYPWEDWVLAAASSPEMSRARGKSGVGDSVVVTAFEDDLFAGLRASVTDSVGAC